jgi:sterol desaturase/sphingolipid hydroxylase (fatty acid hydroxylase superfamily)
VYPLLVGGAFVAVWASVRLGVDTGWTVPVIVAIGVASTVLAERVLPYRAAWQQSHGDVLTDGLYLVFAMAITGELGRRFALWGGGRLAIDVWPHAWPLVAQLALSLVIAEWFGYWFHRIEHEGGRLIWRLHAVHHTAPRLYWLNAARNHPIETPLTALVLVGPLALLGANPSLLAAFSAVVSVHSMLQHSNVDMRLGPFNRLFSAAEPHRWHHSRVLAESNANYGQVLLVWDVVFGTWQMPAREPPVDLGLAPRDDVAGMEAFPVDFVGQVLSPFWSRLW